MQIVHNRKELQQFLRERKELSLGFVPTMGALHEGHISLLKESKRENDLTALSIFVNPTQFGPKEDFAQYPRTWESDLTLAKAAGVDLVFAPTAEEIYPPGFQTFIEVEKVAEPLCGKFRPGHFRGVATVVYQLFALVKPTRAYFGQKDIQQCLVLERMVQDLLLPVELKFCATLREADGLAMSSRNRYLNGAEREQALIISKALKAVKEKFSEGETSVQKLEHHALRVLSTVAQFQVQYCELRSRNGLSPISIAQKNDILAIAGYLGKTRLIDNVFL